MTSPPLAAPTRRPTAAVQMPPGALPAAFILFILNSAGPNWDLALLSAVTLVAGCALLWRPGEPPVLLLVFIWGWVGASVEIFNSTWSGRNLSAWTTSASNMHLATVLSLVGVTAVAVGMRLAAGRPNWRVGEAARSLAQSHPLVVWFRFYAIATVVGQFASIAAWLVPGLFQVILGLLNIRWAFFYMLALSAFTRREPRYLFWIAFAFELLTSVSGFFSDFKVVFFFTLLALAASNIRLRFANLAALALFASLLVAGGVVWTAVKGDLRTFVSGGSGRQVVVVDYSTRMGKLAELMGELNIERLNAATDSFLRRLSYVEFFGISLNFVPKYKPHANGEIILDAVTRPFTPRIMFPWKSEINDTLRTNKYTGGAAGYNNQVTSISLGYVAESFIDFGTIGMFAALTFIGVIYGWIYRRLVSWRRISPLLGSALASATLYNVGALDNSFTKLFGGIIATLIVIVIVCYYIIPVWAPLLVGRR